MTTFQAVSKRDLSYLNQAVRVAENSSCKNKHGVVIVKGSSVLAVGINKYRNHPNVVANPKQDSHYHAEVSAIRAASPKSLYGASLYSARVNRAGALRMAKPCEHCQDVIEAAGIKRVVWTE